LSQFLAYKDNVNTNMCQEVEAAIPAIASMALKRTNKQVLNHLCSCQDCHNKLYQYREIVLNQYLEQAAKIGRDLDVCPSPSVSDYYDYVIPYEFDPQNDQYATFRNSFVRHASACPICLRKMQQLHKTIFTIAERHISETSTIYHINCEKGCENNLPIDVQILNVEDSQKENSQNSNIANTYIQNQAEKSVSKIKSPIKIGLAIAACLLVASGLFLNISTAKAVTLEGLYATIAKIKNIHIMTFIPGNKEAIQERWISKTFNSYITKTGGESVLVDIQKKVKTIKQKDDSIKILPLSSEAVNETQNIISDSLGLMPFRYISQIPKDAQWIAVAEENLEVANDIEVYDLLWSDSFRNNKCRFFLNCETYLPYRIEFYEQIDEKSTYKLKSTKIVEYLTESNIQKVLN
jgi:hypothetical protein